MSKKIIGDAPKSKTEKYVKSLAISKDSGALKKSKEKIVKK